MLPGTRYEVERLHLEPDAALLLYTDGLTEIFQGEEEFGQDRLWKPSTPLTIHSVRLIQRAQTPCSTSSGLPLMPSLPEARSRTT
jgi:serine/threonine protein phosphatase PrpC